MFRASHAINIFKKYGLDLAAKELNHSNKNTTSHHYIKIEDRNLLYDEEDQFFDQELDKILNGSYTEMQKEILCKKTKRKNSKKK
jgi:nucleoside diphosphate kinase